MNSLRARLTLSIVLVVASAGGILVWVVYNETQLNVRELLDDQMEQVAKVVGARVSSEPLAVSPDHEAEDDLVVNVEPEAGKPTGLGIRKGPDQDYRTYRARAGDQSIEVAQGLELRNEIARHVIQAALVPILVLLLLLLVLASVLIRRHLQPLEAAAAAIAARPPLSRSPLAVDGMPVEIRPLIVELNRLLARLGDALDREQRFVADASHALRTPLQALQLQVDVLDGSTELKEIEIRREQLRAGIRRAVRLANHLLLLAQSEHAPVSTATTPLDGAVREIVSAYEAAARAASVAVEIESVPGVFVAADERRLTLVIGNVLDNAIRHSPVGGRIEIKVSAGHRAVVELSDEGPGIPETDLAHAFDRFNRLARADGHGGSGLGLATARSIARQLGGELTLGNRAARPGLVAHFTLPRAPAEAPNAAH